MVSVSDWFEFSRGEPRPMPAFRRPGRCAWLRPVATATQRSVDVDGVTLRVTEAGERGAPLVILVHGFPDLAYCWRDQVPALADAGYHVLAHDQRGYGAPHSRTPSRRTTSPP